MLEHHVNVLPNVHVEEKKKVPNGKSARAGPPMLIEVRYLSSAGAGRRLADRFRAIGPAPCSRPPPARRIHLPPVQRVRDAVTHSFFHHPTPPFISPFSPLSDMLFLKRPGTRC
ncbi:hypothetical protein EVAR_54003_1 [Eumeta japonica]|uniref:Uncharacterized protein n=1 Tax=Eumeta variegata TaxID=151549 RepID=A0A4C1YPZ0_EUMVA|nr:hypothetical protein EVAR_54003_1 [Eumeta japonica]